MNFAQNCGCAPAQDSKVTCPHCGLEGTKISALTLQAHVKKEKLTSLQSNFETFNFCIAAKCPVVYYSNDQLETLSQENVNYKVSIKNEDLDTPLCYCKNLLKKDVIEMIENGEKNIVEKIKEKLFNGTCMCEQTNPRGVSCSEDLTIFLLPYGLIYDKNTTAYKEYQIMKNMTSCCSGIEITPNTDCGC